jgi:hypothetical protein
MERCCHCQGRFGLVSHRYLRKRFCSKECLGTYKRKRAAAIRQRASRWFSAHFEFVAFSHAARPAKVRTAADPFTARIMKLSLNSPDRLYR